MGYRKMAALLRSTSGWVVNDKRVERIWRQEGLKVPRRQPKRSRIWPSDGACTRLRAERPNHVWSYDFVEDRTHDGRKNVIALGPSGTGKTHVALGLGLHACQKGLSVGFTTAAALVNALMEARDERRLLRLQKQIAGYKLLIIDELGFVPLSKTGAELLFETISLRYERGSTLITSNLPFDEWTETFGTERLTGALLDRLTHHVSILEMNGDSYRLAQSRARKSPQAE